VESFRSTLEEVADADLIVHVVDGSDASPEGQVSAVRDVLAEIDAGSVPEIMVVNKVDAADPVTLARLRHLLPGAVFVSARTGEGIEELRERIAAALPDPAVAVRVLVPFSCGALVARVHSEGTVLDEQHTADGTLLSARVPAQLAGALAEFAAPLSEV
jgi:GTP-binding protein HflX